MKKKVLYLIGAIILLIAIGVFVFFMIKKGNNSINPNNSSDVSEKEKLEAEYNKIEDELANIEKERNKKTDLINELSKKRGEITENHPDWEETQIRKSQEYTDLTKQIQELEEEVSKIDESKQSYYDKEIEIQDKMRTLEE